MPQGSELSKGRWSRVQAANGVITTQRVLSRLAGAFTAHAGGERCNI